MSTAAATSGFEGEYERALRRAELEGLSVAGTGWARGSGERVYAVPSRSEPARWHLVVQHDLVFACDCRAAAYGRYCVHRALARQRYIADREREQQAREQRMEGELHRAAARLETAIDEGWQYEHWRYANMGGAVIDAYRG
ncbi:MAG TPA: hypothetical protein VGS80_17845 [Ktedonobacterales bacterium]|nr:hypothetical protein [Ktedonobacterales bacterium]